jgi:hypothetical protein
MYELEDVSRAVPAPAKRPSDTRSAPEHGGVHGPKLSDILQAIAADTSRERISLRDLLAIGRDRAFGALLFIFAVPNVIPTPPGTSAILGIPLLFLAAQLTLGQAQPWLPKLIAERSMARGDFAALIAKVVPWIARAERMLKPRLDFMAHPSLEWVVGGVCLLLSLILFLPIPLGNMLPALAICFLALGVLERDGLAILLGAAVAVVSLAVISGVVWAIVESALYVIRSLF